VDCPLHERRRRLLISIDKSIQQPFRTDTAGDEHYGIRYLAALKSMINI